MKKFMISDFLFLYLKIRKHTCEDEEIFVALVNDFNSH